jgi:hypothetical protein
MKMLAPSPNRVLEVYTQRLCPSQALESLGYKTRRDRNENKNDFDTVY